MDEKEYALYLSEAKTLVHDPGDTDFVATSLVCKWLRKAEKELRAASILLQENLSGESAFHSQQAAEKALKAILAAVDQRPPRTHRLEPLLELMAMYDIDIKSIHELGLETL